MVDEIDERKPAQTGRGGILALAILVAVAGGSWWATRTGKPLAQGTLPFENQDLALSYPAGWLVWDLGWPSTGFGSTFAILGTEGWGFCVPTDLNCHYEVKLEPGQISVSLSTMFLPVSNVCEVGRDRPDLAGRGPDDPPAVGHLMRVDGRPTLATDYAVNQSDYYRSDEWRTWKIAAPGSVRQTFVIDAMYRGPGVSEFRRQLDALVASIHFVGQAAAPNGEPRDCAAPFP